MAQKLFALFGKDTNLDGLLTALNQSKAVTKVNLYGEAGVGEGVSADPDGLDIDLLRAGSKTADGLGVADDTLGTTTPSVSVGQPSGVFMFGESELEAEGLSPEVAHYFMRSVESGARVVVVETRNSAETEGMLKEAGGVVSKGG